jgi:GDP-L-fucose synthase
MNKNSRILVTGAAGLAGSAVIAQLKRRGFTDFIGVARAACDLRDTRATADAFSDIRPEYVFHAAATVYGLQGNIDNQAKAIYDNTLINTSVIDASRRVGVKKLVAMGTNAVYPWPAVLPYREETIFDGRPHEGEAAYGQAKRHMLAMLEAYHANYGLDYTYLVSGNLYGPRDRFNPVSGHVLPSLIAKFYEAAQTQDDVVSIWGDGSARRDFLYSEDLADLVLLFMRNADIQCDNFTGAINIGSGTTHSIAEVAKMLTSISGLSQDRVVFDTSKPTGRPTCFSDLSRLDSLGWTFSTPLHLGLSNTYNWYEAQQTLTKPQS